MPFVSGVFESHEEDRHQEEIVSYNDYKIHLIS